MNTCKHACGYTVTVKRREKAANGHCTYPHAVLNKMEDVLGRAVEPEELQQAMQGMQGQPATVKQLADAVGATTPASCSGRASDRTSQGGEEEFVGEEADLRRFLGGDLTMLFDQGMEEEREEGGPGAGLSDSEADSRDQQAVDTTCWRPLSKPHHADCGACGDTEGEDDTTDDQTCSCSNGLRKTDLCVPSSSGQQPHSRTTPMPNVPSLSLGLLRKNIRMVGACDVPCA